MNVKVTHEPRKRGIHKGDLILENKSTNKFGYSEPTHDDARNMIRVAVKTRGRKAKTSYLQQVREHSPQTIRNTSCLCRGKYLFNSFRGYKKASVIFIFS